MGLLNTYAWLHHANDNKVLFLLVVCHGDETRTCCDRPSTNRKSGQRRASVRARNFWIHLPSKVRAKCNSNQVPSEIGYHKLSLWRKITIEDYRTWIMEGCSLDWELNIQQELSDHVHTSRLFQSNTCTTSSNETPATHTQRTFQNLYTSFILFCRKWCLWGVMVWLTHAKQRGVFRNDVSFLSSAHVPRLFSLPHWLLCFWSKDPVVASDS